MTDKNLQFPTIDHSRHLPSGQKQMLWMPIESLEYQRQLFNFLDIHFYQDSWHESKRMLIRYGNDPIDPERSAYSSNKTRWYNLIQLEIKRHCFEYDGRSDEIKKKVNRVNKEDLLAILDRIESLPLREWDDPVRQYFKSLPEWDGTHRVDKLLTTLFDLPHNEMYVDAIRMILHCIIAKQLHKNVLCDRLVVLVGGQGSGKGEFIRNLLPYHLQADHWTEKAKITDEEQNMLLKCMSKAIIEFKELKGSKKADAESVKAILDPYSMHAIRKYENHITRIPPRYMSFATANDDGHGVLTPDYTGMRRYLPFVIPEHIYDLSHGKKVEEYMQNNLDQLYAEASMSLDSSKKRYNVNQKYYDAWERTSKRLMYNPKKVPFDHIDMHVVLADMPMHVRWSDIRKNDWIIQEKMSDNQLSKVLRSMSCRKLTKRSHNEWYNPYGYEK